MTAQFADTLKYEGETYAIIAQKGEGLFSPSEHGFRPTMMHTACYRGFYCDFEIHDDTLLLTHLVIRQKDNKYQPFGGITPLYETNRQLTEEEAASLQPMSGRYITRPMSRSNDHPEPTLRYDGGIYADLNFPIPLTGGLLIALDFIEGMYIHLGFQRPEAFERVIEMLFEKGKIVQKVNHSETAAKVREQLRNNPKRAGNNDPTRLSESRKDLIEWRFLLDYDLSRIS